MSGTLVWHNSRNQTSIVAVGECMRRAIDSMDSEWQRAGTPPNLHVSFQPDSPAHIVHRFSFGRTRIGWSSGSPSGVETKIRLEPEQTEPGALRLRFTTGCEFQPLKP